MACALQNTPLLEVGRNRSLKRTFEDQLKALIFFHLEEHLRLEVTCSINTLLNSSTNQSILFAASRPIFTKLAWKNTIQAQTV